MVGEKIFRVGDRVIHRRNNYETDKIIGMLHNSLKVVYIFKGKIPQKI